MSRSAAPAGHSLGLAVAAAITTWAALFSWRGFTEMPARFLAPLFLIGLTVACSGAAARAYRAPSWLVVAIQVVVSGAVTSQLLTGSWLPLGPAADELSAALAGAMDSASRYQAPINAAVPSIAPLLVLGGLALLLVVDLLACTLRRVATSGLVLLTIAAIAVGAVGGSISWWVFVATATGFLTMLFLQQRQVIARWSAPSASRTGSTMTAVTVHTNAGTIGALATVLALAVPLLVPTADFKLGGYGSGSGTGAQITVTNPMVDLRRDLVQGPDVPLVRVTTNDPRPSYLRISVLTRFTANTWSSGDREVPASHVANGAMPDLAGVADDVPRREFDYKVMTTPYFISSWLPTQAPISRLVADGDWRYDTSTMDFLAAEPSLTSANMRYEMTATRLRISAQSLATATSSAGAVGREFTQLPASLPPLVVRYARQVTQGATTPFAKAVALQTWFRRDGGFTYDTTTPAGNGSDDLVSFLAEGGDGRIGYCEQFASAMAVMARTLDIPARVAIGFLAPDPVGPRTWEYTAHDLHAWPELYFPGSGWVRFEPTPASRTGVAPGYTRQEVVTIDGTGTDLGGNATVTEELPTRGGRNDAARLEDVTPRQTAQDTVRSTTQVVGVVVLIGLAMAAAVLALLLVVPRWVRQRRRRRRLMGDAEDAWHELRETAIDLGIAWPDGRSPRETRDKLVRHVAPGRATGPAPTAVLALDRIVTEVEQERYGRSERDPGARTGAERGAPVRMELELCLTALAEHAPLGAQRRARWWPRSAMPQPRRRSPVVEAPVESRPGGSVEHLG